MNDKTAVSPVITRFFELMEGADKTLLIDIFTPDAVVTDNDVTYRGREELLGWLAGEASEYTYTSTLLTSGQVDDVAVVKMLLEGDFPGGRVTLRYTFDVTPEDLIGSLTIAV